LSYLISSGSGFIKLPDDDPYVIKTRNVASKILKSVPKDFQVPVEVNVIKGSDWFVKSMVLNGADKLLLYKSMLQFTDIDDQLAFIIGHEVGHMVTQHHGERWHHSFMKALISSFLGDTLGWKSSIIFKIVEHFSTSYSFRGQEYEADFIGAMLMAKSCYNVFRFLILASCSC
jgi:predicted Zn-dependent protease